MLLLDEALLCVQVKVNIVLFIFINDNILNVILQCAVIVYLFLSLRNWHSILIRCLYSPQCRQNIKILQTSNYIGANKIDYNTDTSCSIGWLYWSAVLVVMWWPNLHWPHMPWGCHRDKDSHTPWGTCRVSWTTRRCGRHVLHVHRPGRNWTNLAVQDPHVRWRHCAILSLHVQDN